MLVGRPSIPMVCTSKAGSAAAWVSLIVPGRARGRMIERAASWKLDLASVPIRVDQFSDRVDDPAADSEQDHPHQIVNLLPEIGNRQLHRLRSPGEDRSQEKDDRYRSCKNYDQLVHN